MSKKTKILLIVAIVIIIIAVIFFAFVMANTKEEDSEEEEDLSSVSKPEEFIFYDKYGNQSSIADYGGIPMCVVFFNSSAENARETLDYIDEYYSEYKATVEFLIINTNDPDPDIIETMEEAGYEFDIYYDEDGLAEEYYTFNKLPAVYFIEEDGNIYKQFEGFITEDALEANLDLISGVDY